MVDQKSIYCIGGSPPFGVQAAFLSTHYKFTSFYHIIYFWFQELINHLSLLGYAQGFQYCQFCLLHLLFIMVRYYGMNISPQGLKMMDRPLSIKDLWNGNVSDAVRLTAKQVKDSLDNLPSQEDRAVTEPGDE